MLFDSPVEDVTSVSSMDNSFSDQELVKSVKRIEASHEPYVPIVEDITMDDDVSLDAVNRIEDEQVNFRCIILVVKCLFFVSVIVTFCYFECL